MKKALKLLSFILLGIVFSSCMTYHIETSAEMIESPAAAELQDRSISIKPFDVSLSATRFAIDLRDIHISVNGQAIVLQGRYLVKDDDSTLGRIGVLDVNILELAGLDTEELQKEVTGILLKGLLGKQDYYVGFFNGFGEDNVGLLSNRPIYYDRDVYPNETCFTEGTTGGSYFSEVVILPESADWEDAETDLFLEGSLSLSSEVVEILETGDSTPFSEINDGDYFLTLTGHLDFEVIDTATGEVIISDRSEFPYHTAEGAFNYDVELPITNGDAASYTKYFRDVDFMPYALEAVNRSIPGLLPFVSPYYVNTTHVIYDED